MPQSLEEYVPANPTARPWLVVNQPRTHFAPQLRIEERELEAGGLNQAGQVGSYLSGIRSAKYSTSWEAAGGSRLLRLTTT